MMQKMKKISLMACSLLATATLVSGVCAISKYQVVAEEANATPSVTVDTTSKSAWEANGYVNKGAIKYIIKAAN